MGNKKCYAQNIRIVISFLGMCLISYDNTIILCTFLGTGQKCVDIASEMNTVITIVALHSSVFF